MNQKGFAPIFILVGVLIIISVLIGGVYFARNKLVYYRSKVSPSRLLPSDETKDWKTYRGSGYIYTFKYPPDWVEKPATLSTASPTFESPNIQYDEVEGLRVVKGKRVFVTVSWTNQTLDEIEQEDRNYKPCEQCDTPSFLKIERIKLDKQDVLKELGTLLGSHSLTYTLVHEEQKFVFACNYPGDDESGEIDCEKILATFRFLTEKERAGETQILWQIEEVGQDPQTDAMLTKVDVEIKDKVNRTYEMGTFRGRCFELAESKWELLTNEISGVICGWGGAGDEVGVFEENRKLVIKRGKWDEGAPAVEGQAAIPFFRGDFTTILEVK